MYCLFKKSLPILYSKVTIGNGSRLLNILNYTYFLICNNKAIHFE